MSDPRQKRNFKSVRKENERKENEKAKAYYNRHQLQTGDDALVNDGDISDEDFAPAPVGKFKRKKRPSDEAKEVKSAIHHGGGSRDIDKSQRPSTPKRQKNELLPQKHQSERPGFRQAQVDNQKKHEAELARRAEEQHRLEQQSRRDAEAARLSAPTPASETIPTTYGDSDQGVPEEVISPSMQAAMTIKLAHSPHELYIADIFDMNDLGAAEAQQELLQNLAQLCKDDPKFKNSWGNPGVFYGEVNTQLGHLRGVITILQKNRQKRINDFQSSRPQTTPKKKKYIKTIDPQKLPKISWLKFKDALSELSRDDLNGHLTISDEIVYKQLPAEVTEAEKKFKMALGLENKKKASAELQTKKLEILMWKFFRHYVFAMFTAPKEEATATQPADGAATQTIENGIREVDDAHAEASEDQFLAIISGQAFELSEVAVAAFTTTMGKRIHELQHELDSTPETDGIVNNTGAKKFELHMLNVAVHMFGEKDKSGSD